MSKYATSKIRQTLEFKRASLKDAGVLFDLANDPVVRQNARSSHPITLIEHLSWLTAKISDPTTYLYLVYITSNTLVGAVCYNSTHSDKTCSEISLWIYPQFRGIGLGKQVLQNAIILTKELGIGKIKAEILDTNIASKKLFLAAGFKPYNTRKVEERCFEVYQLSIR